MRTSLHHVNTIVLALTLGGLLAGKVSNRAFDAAVRILHEINEPPARGMNLPPIRALRQLRDASTQPLLARLTEHSDWQVNVHAILGLAELSKSRRVDPFLITQLDSEHAQDAVVENAISLDLIDTDLMSQLLQDRSLAPLARVRLSAALVKAGHSISHEQLRTLADNTMLDIKGDALLLIAHIDQHSALEELNSIIEAKSRTDRIAPLRAYFDFARLNDLSSVAEWISHQVRSFHDPPIELIVSGVGANLALDPDQGVADWQFLLGSNAPATRQVRFGLLLLEYAQDVPAATFDLLNDQSLVTRSIVNAGKAVSNRTGESTAIITLINLDHVSSGIVAMRVAEQLDLQQAKAIYRHNIMSLASQRKSSELRIELAIESAAKIVKLDVEESIRLLKEQDDDSLAQEVMLVGMLDSESRELSQAAGQLPRLGTARADALALMLYAKHAESLDKNELQQLGLIATGGSNVSYLQQTKAAWLFLRHTDQIDKALASAFSSTARAH